MSFEAMPIYTFLLLLSLILLLYNVMWHQKQRNDKRKRPPGPPTLPIIGNFHMLGALPHRSLQSLSQKYGPIMSLKLGQVPAIVVSSSKTAELFLKAHDTVFASRPKTQVTEILLYGSKGMSFSEYGPYWRTMKKMITVHLLSASKVELFAPTRKEELDFGVKSLRKVAGTGQVVNLSEVVQSIIENMMHKIVFGGSNHDDQVDLKRLVKDGIRLEGTFNLADFVPWLGAFDLQGIARECKKLSKEVDELLEKTIEQHQQDANNISTNKDPRKDFMDIMLSMMDQPMDDSQDGQNHILDRTNIKAILLEMISASIDTTATVIEWGLSELLRHPRVMNILQEELENVVGLRRMVQEKDLIKLNYLDMVLNEILRLYPVGPLLLPRESRENVTIDGYDIDKKTRVIVNAWTIGRDPNIWSDNAEEFYPERFINKKIDFRGQDLSFIPFGSGRRSCPGINLGLTTAKSVLAQLMHCFNWELPCNITPSNLNMEEKFGLSMPRALPLKAIPTYRLASNAM